jgi:hypothetical protein
VTQKLELLHVDACCWIDLFASGRIEEIVRALPYEWVSPEYVIRHEVLSIGSGGSAEEPCDFSSLFSKGLLSVRSIKSEEEKGELVRFASLLDDGEAAVCALARTHGGRIATNDRKVIKVLGRFGFKIPVVGTPELIFQWADIARLPRPHLRDVILNITTKARFSPRRDVPFAERWYEILS